MNATACPGMLPTMPCASTKSFGCAHTKTATGLPCLHQQIDYRICQQLQEQYTKSRYLPTKFMQYATPRSMLHTLPSNNWQTTPL